MNMKFQLITAAAMLVASTIVFPDGAQAGCSQQPGGAVEWDGCRKRNLMLGGHDFSGSKMAGTDLASTDLRDTILNGANLQKAVLLRASFDGSSAVDTNFKKAIGYRTSFRKTNLKGASFEKAEMQRANFSGAHLEEASFAKSEVGRANFTQATLQNNDFSYANLARADFSGARMSGKLIMVGAFLFRTNLSGSDISRVEGLAQWQVDMACGDNNTQLPPGLKAPGTWPCTEE